MKMFKSLLSAALVLFFSTQAFAGKKRWSDEIDIPYKKYTLPNGLRLIVHEDHKAPMVAVNIWYHVGSKNEKPGRTGFAHLFEHLMFNGSKNYNDDYFKALDKAGVTSINGSTGFDRTNYFQVMPTSSLDTVLWMESDRMGHMVDAIDQKKLDEQRGVVQNEKRQRENEPYGKAYETLFRYSYPSDHPYSWLPIGSMEDLNAASLEDVRQWFRSYYGAANAVLSIAGDINAEEVHQKVQKYFGWIPSGPPVSRPRQWIAPRTESTRVVMQDRVPLARLYKYWNIPDLRDSELDDLDLFSDILANGKNSRLYKRLVYRDQIASDVSAAVGDGEIGSQFEIIVTAKEGQALSKVELALNDELKKALQGITKSELENKKTQYYAMLVRKLEKIGSYSGKAEMLARGETYYSDPVYFKKDLDHVQGLTASALTKVANKWLSSGDLTLEIHPYEDGKTIQETVDRTKVPYPKEYATRDFPAFERSTLSNGLRLVLLERKETPIVDMNLIFDGGYVGEQELPRGTAKMTMALLTEGTQKIPALKFSDRLEKLASSISTSISLTNASVRMSCMKRALDESLALYADAILHPAFREIDQNRILKQMVANLAYEKSSPDSIVMKVLPKLFYGSGHPYAIPGSGVEDEKTLKSITEKHLREYYHRWFRPDNATLVIVGDFDSKVMKKRLEAALGRWKSTGPQYPSATIPIVAPKTRPQIFLIDRPDSLQSLITASYPAPAKSLEHEPELVAMNLAFGGMFNSRVNMNLREDKHWSYGARSGFSDTKMVRQFAISASVQTDQTAPSMAEIQKEIVMAVKSKPFTKDELGRSQITQTVGFSNSWETNAAVMGYLSSLVSLNLPDDYYIEYPKRAKQVTLKELQASASLVMNPNAMLWLVVGDQSKVEPSIRALRWADVTVLDVDGNPIRKN